MHSALNGFALRREDREHGFKAVVVDSVLVGWKVGVALGSVGQVPIGNVGGLGEGPTMLEALHEIGIADEGTSEGDQVGD